MSIEELKRRYPWPKAQPEVPVEGVPGWFPEECKVAMHDAGTNWPTSIIVELGSWFGLSTLFFAETPATTIICIDHWKGDGSITKNPEWAAQVPYSYHGFLRNLWDYRERVIPMRQDTVMGMMEIDRLGIRPDLIYVDASHDEESVYDDVSAAMRLFPITSIFGDDWRLDSVRKGLARCNIEVRVHGRNCWEKI